MIAVAQNVPVSDYALILGFIGGIIPVIGAVLACQNWLNTRFAHLERAIAQSQSDIRLLEQKWDSTEDKITLVANGSGEAVKHARERFFDEINSLRRELVSDLRDITRYLEVNGTFVRRGHESHGEND